VAISWVPKPKGLGNEPLHFVGAPADIDLEHSEQQRGRLSGHLAREGSLYVRVLNYG